MIVIVKVNLYSGDNTISMYKSFIRDEDERFNTIFGTTAEERASEIDYHVFEMVQDFVASGIKYDWEYVSDKEVINKQYKIKIEELNETIKDQQEIRDIFIKYSKHTS